MSGNLEELLKDAPAKPVKQKPAPQPTGLVSLLLERKKQILFIIWATVRAFNMRNEA